MGDINDETSETDLLKQKLVILHSTLNHKYNEQNFLLEDDVINLYANYYPLHCKNQSITMNNPLSLMGMLKKDAYGRCSWGVISRRNKLQNTYPNDTSFQRKRFSEEVTKEGNNERAMKKRLYEDEGIEDVQPYKKTATGKKIADVILSPQSFEKELFELIKKSLPPYDRVLHYTDVFFKEIQPMFPYIERQEFESAIAEIFDDKELTLSKKLDFATIGITITMIILASLLEQFKADSKDLDIDKLMRLCLLCKERFTNIRRSNLLIIQFFLYLKITRFYCPQFGESIDNADHLQSYSEILQLAKLTGLNRDPTYLKQFPPKGRDIWRKIWYALLQFDTYESSLFGSRLLVHEDDYDTKLPEDGDRELFGWTHELNVAQNEILQYSLSLKAEVKTKTLIRQLEAFQELADAKLGRLDEIMSLPISNPHEIRGKMYKFKKFLDVKMFLISMYKSLLVHFENSINIFCYKKTLQFMVSEMHHILPQITSILPSLHHHFDTHTAELILPHHIVTTIMKYTFQALTSLTLRLIHFKSRLSPTERAEKAATLDKCYSNWRELFIWTRSKLQQVYAAQPDNYLVWSFLNHSKNPASACFSPADGTYAELVQFFTADTSKPKKTRYYYNNYENEAEVPSLNLFEFLSVDDFESWNEEFATIDKF